MNVFNEIDMRKKLDENLVYMENMDNNLSEDKVINFFKECLDYCNKLSLYDYKEKIKEKIYELGYKDDIRLELGLNNPYLYIDNDDYSNNEYFVGKFRKDIINLNKEFSYKFQYDKYKRNGIHFKTNKQDVDYVIRNYKNILLNTTNKELNKLCLNKIYEIYENNSFIEILDKDDIEIIEYNTEEREEDLVSIMILSYNNDDYIEGTIKSIYEQTYKNIELIIADDCSKNLDIDKFKGIIDRYKSSNIKRVIIYKNKINLGTVSNANKAICLSCGKYIKFIGSDDLFYNKDVIWKLIDHMNNNDLEILSCETEINDIHMNHIEVTDNYSNLSECLNENFINNKELYNLLYQKGSIIDTTATIFSKSIFKKYGLFDENYLLVEDWPYWLKLSETNCLWGYDDLMTVKYRRGSGVTSLRSKGVNSDFMSIWKKYYPHWLNKLYKLY